MVYESDFYTTRRPYRPASSYSVSDYHKLVNSFLFPRSKTYQSIRTKAELIYRPSARTVTRLATYPEPPHHVVRVRVRPSVVMRELDRISHRPRSSYALNAVEDFYRSESTRQFEDETRRIRADTASALQRARSVVPRAKSVMPLDSIYTIRSSFENRLAQGDFKAKIEAMLRAIWRARLSAQSSYNYGEPMPYRFSSDAYATKLLLPLRNVHDTVRDAIKHISYWHEPARKFTGRGHLACVHYSGNKAFSNRRPLYKELSIRDDVNLLSFYAKNRLAAAGLGSETVTAGNAPEQPSAA